MRGSAFPASSVRKMPRSRTGWATVLPIVTAIVFVDIVTKWWAERTLHLYGPSVDIIGDYARFTLVYNRGAAFGLSLGAYSRWLFIGLTIVALFILLRLLLQTPAGNNVRLVAISLVSAGAIGNLIDRLRSDMGVVDFIDIGIPAYRWPTFNVADMAVSCGAFLLAWVLWKEETHREKMARLAASGAKPEQAPN